jgi:hypothetical protein
VQKQQQVAPGLFQHGLYDDQSVFVVQLPTPTPLLPHCLHTITKQLNFILGEFHIIKKKIHSGACINNLNACELQSSKERQRL